MIQKLNKKIIIKLRHILVEFVKRVKKLPNNLVEKEFVKRAKILPNNLVEKEKSSCVGDQNVNYITRILANIYHSDI